MSKQNRDKLKRLISSVPPGALVDSMWFRREQIARATVHGYVKRGWIVRLAHGVFIRPNADFDHNDPIHWQVVASSMHHLMAIPFHIGGIKALDLHGHLHFLQLGGRERIDLYAVKLPGWLMNIHMDADITTRRPGLFPDLKLGVEHVDIQGLRFGDNPTFPLSSPERAILEALDELRTKDHFERIDLIFQGLSHLSPKKLMPLLKDCCKIKVIRLFFVFADRHNHAWSKYLDTSMLDFGVGDRQLVKGGSLHPRYRITVPEEFVM